MKDHHRCLAALEIADHPVPGLPVLPHHSADGHGYFLLRGVEYNRDLWDAHACNY